VGFKRRVLKTSTGGVTFILAHLSLMGRSRRHQVADLARFAQDVEGPLVIMGDLNALPDSPELQVLVTEAGLTRVPTGGTYPSWRPTKALDHIFVSQDVKVVSSSVPDVKLSDHLPVMMDLDVDG
ncbi:MAG: endonuclease/exonuclease/phosphatase family protein, partial [Thermoplasmata archaeon]